ncbi:putative signal peptide-containing protein [Cryptosporidium canis]|uniref:Signal peptide-containing protein n=1 Tax=Cryptosporidium canis TaxID=195482 RepID=A0A9D5HYW3_9CRYT|nr:putative signal peptide-containing protein [Cryptosporidium canis]
MRNVHILGLILVLLLAFTEQSQCLKVKSFFFGLGSGDKKEEKHEDKNDGKHEDGPKPTQDTNGVNPAAGVSKSGDHHSEEAGHSGENSHPPENGHPPESSHPAESEAVKHEDHPGEASPPPPPSSPPPPPPPSPPSSPPAPGHQSGCSCSAAEKPLSDCCYEAVYGENRPPERRNATITGTITGTITDSVLSAKTGDVISVKHDSDKPVPECGHSQKQSVMTTTHEAHTNLHSLQNGKLPSLQSSPSAGKGKFPNGANFIPLVLDANTGQYGVEFKTLDMLVTGQDEKIKPFDMLIPFVNEDGQIKFVTRRRLRQLVKLGLSKGFSEGAATFSKEAVAEDAAEAERKPEEKSEEKPEKHEEKPEEKPEEKHEEKPSQDHEKKEGESSAAESGKEVANSAKNLLQEAEAVLTGGSLFESAEKKDDDKDDKKPEESKSEEGEAGSDKKESGDSEEASESSSSEAAKSKSSESESVVGAQDSASVHASEEEEEEDEQ